MSSFPPGLALVCAAAVVAGLPSALRRWALLMATVGLLAYLVWGLHPGDALHGRFLGMPLMPTRVDELSLVFGYAFAVVALLGSVYALHLKDRGQQVALLVFAGSAQGVVFAGDLLTLVTFWEGMAFAASYLVWARKTRSSDDAGSRYLAFHLVGGAVLLAGVLWHVGESGSLVFQGFKSGPASWLILGGFAVNAAIPPLHAWLPDAYPESTVPGGVFLSALTTKAAVYALARGFGGWEVLVWAGVGMALYGVVYALRSDDIRRVQAYGIISQVGYMAAAVGIGTDLAINGAAAHAFGHVLYKALLFMAAGAVLQATGRSAMSELGGLGGRLGFVLALHLVGALSLAAAPLTIGFVTKSVIIAAAEEAHRQWVVLVLYVVSAGSLLYAGLRVPYLVWLRRSGNPTEVRALPLGMIIAMSLAAVISIGLGVYPQPLYELLPHTLDYEPYTVTHVLSTLHLLLFAAVAFWLLRRFLEPRTGPILDTDILYRKTAQSVKAGSQVVLARLLIAAGHFRALRFGPAERMVLARARALARPVRRSIEVGDRGLPTAAAAIAGVLGTLALMIAVTLLR